MSNETMTPQQLDKRLNQMVRDYESAIDEMELGFNNNLAPTIDTWELLDLADNPNPNPITLTPEQQAAAVSRLPFIQQQLARLDRARDYEGMREMIRAAQTSEDVVLLGLLAELVPADLAYEARYFDSDRSAWNEARQKGVQVRTAIVRLSFLRGLNSWDRADIAKLRGRDISPEQVDMPPVPNNSEAMEQLRREYGPGV